MSWGFVSTTFGKSESIEFNPRRSHYIMQADHTSMADELQVHQKDQKRFAIFHQYK